MIVYAQERTTEAPQADSLAVVRHVRTDVRKTQEIRPECERFSTPTGIGFSRHKIRLVSSDGFRRHRLLGKTLVCVPNSLLGSHDQKVDLVCCTAAPAMVHGYSAMPGDCTSNVHFPFRPHRPEGI